MQSANGLVCPVRGTGGEPPYGVSVGLCSESAEVKNGQEPPHLFMTGQVEKGRGIEAK